MTDDRLAPRNDGISLWRELSRPVWSVSRTRHFPVIPFASSGLTSPPERDWGATAD